MPDFEMILEEYRSLRESGVDPKTALRRLGNHIKPLEQYQKEELAAIIRQYEGGDPSATTPKRTQEMQQQLGAIKPLKPQQNQSPPPSQPQSKSGGVRSLADSTKALEREYCWKCGKPNRKGEVICVHCGAIQKQSTGSTKKLNNAVDHNPEYFGRTSRVILRVRKADHEITLRPQDSEHEMIIGRRDAAGVVVPDVDLTDYEAEDLGVSRMHMSVQYNSDQEVLLVTDLGSANGLYVNGQRMVTKEQRVLRDGDQLRLGELVINVFYDHG
jgi:predicted component of type VI protein secretion system